MIVPSYFGYLAENQNLQGLINNSQLALEEQSLWRNWLDQGTPQMSLTFEQAIGRDRIEAAASIVDEDAPAPLRSRNTLELLTGKIPAMKEKFRLQQSEMRTLEVLKALPIVNAKPELIALLDRDVSAAATAGDKRVDIMLMQGISNLAIDVNTTNNPDGVAYGTVDLLAKSYQKQGVPTVWTDVASTPFDDIQGYTEYVWKTWGYRFGRIVISYALWLNMKKTTQVKSYLQTFYNVGKANASFAVTLDSVNEYMAANMLPVIEIINDQKMIEVNGSPTYYRAFNQNNVSFLPAGKVGTLINAMPMERLHPIAIKSYASFGPTLVGKWCEQDPLTEFTSMEMLAFPAINVDGIFILKTDTVQASFNTVGS